MCVRADYVTEYVVLEEFSPPVVTNLTSGENDRIFLSYIKFIF